MTKQVGMKEATPFVLNPLPPALLYLWLPVPWYACFQKNWYFIIASTWFCVSTGFPPARPIVFGRSGVVDSHRDITVFRGFVSG